MLPVLLRIENKHISQGSNHFFCLKSHMKSIHGNQCRMTCVVSSHSSSIPTTHRSSLAVAKRMSYPGYPGSLFPLSPPALPPTYSPSLTTSALSLISSFLFRSRQSLAFEYKGSSHFVSAAPVEPSVVEPSVANWGDSSASVARRVDAVPAGMPTNWFAPHSILHAASDIPSSMKVAIGPWSGCEIPRAFCETNKTWISKTNAQNHKRKSLWLRKYCCKHKRTNYC